MATLAINQLQLAPLGAGDLIDRTIRLYRRHFVALIRASAPPVVVSAIGSVLYTVMTRAIGSTDSEVKLVFYILLSITGLALAFVGFLLQLIVMGGSSRNLVTHLLRDEPVTARAIYRNVRARFWGLLGATLLVVLWVSISAGIASIVLFIVALIIVVFAALMASLIEAVPWLAAIIGIIIYLAGVVGVLFVFFFLAGRAAYVPQVLMVEGKGVFDSIGRSVVLARGNVRRLLAMFLFTSFATYAALMLLLIPLGWVGYLYGVDLLQLDYSRVPVWYAVSYQVVVQVSTILLAPVWTLGLSLLYVDERVRHEGYDIELLAAQRLGEMPALPYGTMTPLTPAVAADAPTTSGETRREAKTTGSVLGLLDR
ncbi:MAG: hypothetical protein LC754_16715 [Acidobacteria bacterium]|nr:hypothetical protein [Acidobacteriota bacterium]